MFPAIISKHRKVSCYSPSRPLNQKSNGNTLPKEPAPSKEKRDAVNRETEVDREDGYSRLPEGKEWDGNRE
jgi:hypothetical protein